MDTLRIWIDTYKEVGKRGRFAAHVLSRIIKVQTVLGVHWKLPFASPVFVGTCAALVVEREDSVSDVGHELCLTGALVEVIETVFVMICMSVMCLGTLRFGSFV
jgi:hypothetical protein